MLSRNALQGIHAANEVLDAYGDLDVIAYYIIATSVDQDLLDLEVLETMPDEALRRWLVYVGKAKAPTELYVDKEAGELLHEGNQSAWKGLLKIVHRDQDDRDAPFGKLPPM